VGPLQPVMAEYDALAGSYNELHGQEQAEKARIIAGRLGSTAGDTILDVGCGSGLGGQYLEGKITGIDPSAELLKQCPIKAVQGVAEDLPFADNSFDFAICVSAVHNFTDAEKGLKEIARVTRQKVAITLLKKAAKYEEIKAHIERIFEVTDIIDQTNDKIFIVNVRG